MAFHGEGTPAVLFVRFRMSSWGKWGQQHGTENLTAADLSGATMVNTVLAGANLTKANFTGANLEHVILTRL